MSRNGTVLQVIDSGDLFPYPLTADDRIDSHFFMAWERRRWLNSGMRLKGTPECRSIYFDLICVSYDQMPVGTLPYDIDQLSKLAHMDRQHLEQLCRLEYGPLHKWTRCQCDGEIRLYHPFVLKSLLDAIARKEDNRAKHEAANISKRMLRLRSAVAGVHAELAKNDAAVQWMDEWLTAKDCGYRTTSWVERAITAWSGHIFDLRNGTVKLS